MVVMNIKTISLNNLRDLTIFFTINNFTDIFHTFKEQLILALIIVVVNSLIIPFVKYVINSVKDKFPNYENELDKLEKDIIEKIEEEVRKLGDKDD